MNEPDLNPAFDLIDAEHRPLLRVVLSLVVQVADLGSQVHGYAVVGRAGGIADTLAKVAVTLGDEHPIVPALGWVAAAYTDLGAFWTQVRAIDGEAN